MPQIKSHLMANSLTTITHTTFIRDNFVVVVVVHWIKLFVDYVFHFPLVIAFHFSTKNSWSHAFSKPFSLSLEKVIFWGGKNSVNYSIA